MRITRRTSGGRGEYEISEETATGLRPADLHEKRLIFDFGEGWLVDTATKLVLQAGKHRIRQIQKTAGDMQIHRQLAAALMMPHPVREDINLAGGLPVMRAERYAIEHIQLGNVELTQETATLTISEVVLRNMSYHAQNLGYAERVANVRTLWHEAGQLPVGLRGMIVQHHEIAAGGGPLRVQLEGIVENLQTSVTTLAEDLGVVYRSADSDVLPDLLSAIEIAQQPPEPPISVDQVDPQETQVRRRVVAEWKRWANSRGATSATFRQQVRAAYASTCLVCGICLPATSVNAVPGVDAAHILPWATYDLDVISNGLCLCRVHHWAFDEGLVVITAQNGSYYLTIPDDVAETLSEQSPHFSLDSLQQYAGLIPQHRLPTNPQHWPSPLYLEMLNQNS